MYCIKVGSYWDWLGGRESVEYIRRTTLVARNVFLGQLQIVKFEDKLFDSGVLLENLLLSFLC
jgi:hypothetical protein